MSEKRLIGDYPVIGIRPIIDARKGILDVRGSLEGQTMAMAQAAKQLLETNLKYTDGSPVRVIILILNTTFITSQLFRYVMQGIWASWGS